ncbi:elongation factor G2-like protein [Trypanosoma brucei brucei TREU927]|uniref:Elongation factor G2-like protein n=2 Tax=Trypanosoma brucei TaxID=5691 RepID=Q384D0_TRYB2|nr:elongation factor G2-like protein [Trypanosoma brucei brucei TREU927]EAN79851.1 elongation factor G2-like protein [Trypanosoma brucei brucei TREU927]
MRIPQGAMKGFRCAPNVRLVVAPSCSAIVSALRCLTQSPHLWCSRCSTGLKGDKSKFPDASTALIRNIGIVAHIDAGKTTTTERMLFYAGAVKRVGDVDSGTTTMDFMKEEMDRGITIQSAAVSFQWRGHSIHLIDTPGHVDFTVEVERAMRVVDGVVALFDASAGVQAQSYTVLRQSKKFGVPVIAFLNKMDKYNADFTKCVNSIRKKLEMEPLLLQLPLSREDGSFDGVVDVVELKSYRFSGDHGSNVIVGDLRAHRSEPPHVVEAARDARHALLSTLTSVDDSLADAVIAALDETGGDEQRAEDAIPCDVLRAAIRRQTLRQNNSPRPVIPVLCGASRRDQGVQPVLDAITYYLPSPQDRVLYGYTKDGELVQLPPATTAPYAPFFALAFKVIHTMGPKGQRQPLVFFRVYSGRITARTTLVNNSSNSHENIEKLYVMHADHQVEVPHLAAGHIGAAFMRNTKTGATLYREPQHAQSVVAGCGKEVFTLEGIDAPSPVISFSIEAASKHQISLLEETLQELSFEDPSLRVSRNNFGQIVISGMGELHLEIVMSRLEHSYGLKCRLLRAIIEYREVVREPVELKNVIVTNNEVPYIECSLRLQPLLDDEGVCGPSEVCSFIVDEAFAGSFLSSSANEGGGDRRRRMDDCRRNAVEELRLITEVFNKALSECFLLGPLAGLPLHGVRVVLTGFRRVAATQLTDRPLAQAARSLLLQLLQAAPKTTLAALEPMMEVEVHLSEPTYIGEVVSSLNERKAVTVDIQEDGKSVSAILPMRNIVRYTMELRKAVKGHANLYVRLHHYRTIEDKAVLSRIMKNLGIYDS